jgi:hypothetical protein
MESKERVIQKRMKKNYRKKIIGKHESMEEFIGWN